MAESETPKKTTRRAKIVRRIKKDNEIGARKALIEELFYDFRRSKHEVYWINFFRGIAFGLGSVIGGTIVIALLIWLLSTLGYFIPPLDNFVDGVTQTIESNKK